MSKSYDILIRVSRMGARDEADESTHTIDDQMRASVGEIKRRGGTKGKVFKMLDESGGTILPKIQDEIAERVRSGKSRGLIVAYGDRLCREALDGLVFFKMMSEIDGDIVDCTMPEIDYRTDEGRLIWLMKMAINEQPRLQAKKRANRLADDQVAAGIANVVPYGYRRNAQIVEGGAIVKTDPDRPEKALVVDELTAPIVQRVFAMRADGTSWAGMCDELNGEGIPGPKGGLWVPSTLGQMIRNEVYTGVVKLKTRRNEDAHQPLVSRALWKRVKASKSTRGRGHMVAGIAGGLLHCASCGGVMSVRQGGSNGKTMLTYGCRSRTSKGKCPRPLFVSKQRADDYVEEAILRLTLDDDAHVKSVASAREIEHAQADHDASIAATKRVLTFIHELSEDDRREVYALHKTNEQRTGDHLRDLLSRADDAVELPRDESGWHALDDERKRTIARQLIERVDVSAALSRSPHAAVEDRFQIVLVGGLKMAGSKLKLVA
jgi:DNA invertase Pin-like site-specific DNA recombinase